MLSYYVLEVCRIQPRRVLDEMVVPSLLESEKVTLYCGYDLVVLLELCDEASADGGGTV